MPINPIGLPMQPTIEPPQRFGEMVIEAAKTVGVQALERAEIAAAERLALLVAGVNYPRPQQGNTLDPKKHRTYFKMALAYKTHLLGNGTVDVVIVFDFLTGQFRIFRKGGPKDGVVLKPQLDAMVVNNYRFNVAGKLTLKSPPANTPVEARRRLYYMGVNELAKQLTGDENGEVDKATYDPWTGAKEFSMSVEDLYEKIRASTAGTVKEVHFFGHAWLGGPIIVNTMAYPDKRYDKDGRVKDFTTDKLNHVFDPQNRPHFQAAFASGAFTTVWGCENNKPARDLITAAKGKEKAGENFDAELRQLRQFLADTYANQLAKASGKTVYGPLPGTYSVHEGEPNDDGSGIAFTPTAMHVNLEKCGHLLEFYKKHLGVTFPTTGVFKGHATFGRGYAVYSP